MQSTYKRKGSQEWERLELGFTVAASLTIIMVIWASDVFWRLVDMPCVKFAKWLEGKVFVQ